MPSERTVLVTVSPGISAQTLVALAKANAEAIKNNIPLQLKRFESYVMRHTRLANFCLSGCFSNPQ